MRSSCSLPAPVFASRPPFWEGPRFVLALGPSERWDLRAAEPPAAPPLLAEPSLSPDGSEIAFVSGGDIWAVPASGGTAHLLIWDPANESRPLYSPDGRRLAFTSTRAGGAPEIYVLTFEGDDVRRLTFDDASEALDGWSPDGRWVYFSSNGRDVSRMNDVYRVPVGGGTPAALIAGRYVDENMAAPSPDGRAIAFVGRASVVAPGQQPHRPERALAASRGKPGAVRTAGAPPASGGHPRRAADRRRRGGRPAPDRGPRAPRPARRHAALTR